MVRKHGAHLAGEHVGTGRGRLLRFVADKPERGRRLVPEREQRLVLSDFGVYEHTELALEGRTLLVIGRIGEFRVQFGRAQKNLSALLFAERPDYVLF